MSGSIHDHEPRAPEARELRLTREEVRKVGCPSCGARPGAVCRRPGKRGASHIQRLYLAQDLALGTPISTALDHLDQRARQQQQKARLVWGPIVLTPLQAARVERGARVSAVADVAWRQL